MKSIAVLGLGRFGMSVARTIAKGDDELIVIDKDPKNVQAISKLVPNSVIADCSDESVLMSLGVKNCDTAVVAVGSDLETAILATVALKELGVKKVIVKAVNERNASILYKIGADQVILPEHEMGVRVANAITESDILDSINLSSEYSIVEITAPGKWIGKTIAQLDLRGKYSLTVLAIKRENDIVISPMAIEEIFLHDVCVLIGKNTDIERLKAK
jgi:trk system potassium uptake protein TrkA